MKAVMKCIQCGNDFPLTTKVNGIQKNLRSRKRCLDCSPYYSHLTRKLMSVSEKQGKHKICHICSRILPIEQFYNSRRDGYKNSYCSTCQSKKIRNSRQRFKTECIKYLGGKCQACGYHKCVDAMEFHHMNPTQKEFQLSRHSGSLLSPKVKLELDKCQLLCCRCHREEHYRLCRERNGLSCIE